MKKAVIFVLSLIFSAGMFAQVIEMKPISVSLNGGGYAGMQPMGDYEGNQLYDLGVVELNAKYMFNENFGVMIGSRYNTINLGEDVNNTNYVNCFAHLVADVGPLMGSENMGLCFHLGAGAAAMWQKDRFSENTTSRMFNKADEIITMGAGIDYYIKINEQWAYHLAYNYTMHTQQSRHFDMGELMDDSSFEARYMSFTLGVSYHFDF
ncbi:MAG: outer membrane beta-barrel protein [Bacteroidota bacterium]|nr:outer membrane beta-barrel protein [Bacteroidota bacterium]